MTFVLYVRASGAGGGIAQRTPADLATASEGAERIAPETAVSLSEQGPFEPLALAVGRNGALRDVLARDIPIPSLRDHRRLRIALAAIVALPLVMLLELDREFAFGRAGPSRIAIDLMLCAWVVFELSRFTPRMPKIAAMCLAAVALRWILVATKMCGWHVHPLVWAAGALSIAGSLLFLFRVPSRQRVTLELLGKLGTTRSELFRRTTASEPPPALVAAAIACAAGLPAMLHLTRALGASFAVQSIVFVGFAIGAPIAARRLGELGAPAAASLPPVRILLAIATGLALTAAAVSAGRLFFDAGAEIARCVNRLDSEARLARAAEAHELARAVAQVRGSVSLVMLTAAVFPFAEERIFRGLLQDVLARKYGPAYGIFAAAVAFGVAHLGVYEVALYQTVLLGIGFGIAYAEGGLLAAFIVHAAWNVLQIGSAQ